MLCWGYSPPRVAYSPPCSPDHAVRVLSCRVQERATWLPTGALLVAACCRFVELRVLVVVSGTGRRLSWSAMLAFEAPIPLCPSCAPWILQDDNSQYAHVLDGHARGERRQGLGEWSSLGSVTPDALPSSPHPRLVAQRSCVLKLRSGLG